MRRATDGHRSSTQRRCATHLAPAVAWERPAHPLRHASRPATRNNASTTSAGDMLARRQGGLRASWSTLRSAGRLMHAPQRRDGHSTGLRSPPPRCSRTPPRRLGAPVARCQQPDRRTMSALRRFLQRGLSTRAVEHLKEVATPRAPRALSDEAAQVKDKCVRSLPRRCSLVGGGWQSGSRGQKSAPTAPGAPPPSPPPEGRLRPPLGCGPPSHRPPCLIRLLPLLALLAGCAPTTLASRAAPARLPALPPTASLHPAAARRAAPSLATRTPVRFGAAALWVAAMPMPDENLLAWQRPTASGCC